MKDNTGVKNEHGALNATRTASMLVHIIDGAGLPYRIHMYNKPQIVADMPAIIVLTATMPMRPSVAASDEPALKPNQPNARMKVPSCTIGMWCGMIGLTLPSAPYLPMRGPIRSDVITASAPPCRWTTPEPA